MKFYNSIYGKYCSIFFNNFLSPQTKYNELSDSFITLKKLLISGETKFPKLTLKLEELIDVNNITYFNVFTSLVRLENGKAVGFSKTKIYENINENIDFVLEDLDSDYKNLVLQLQDIYDITNKNVNNYKLLIYLLTNIDTLLRSNTDLANFDLYTSLFRYLYNKLPLSTNSIYSTKYKDLQIPSITSIIFFQSLKRLFETVDNPTIKLLNLIYSSGSLILNRSCIHVYYRRYLQDNIVNISSDLTDFIINNILDFGVNVSSNVSIILRSKIQTILNETPELVKKNLKILAPSDYIYRISNGVIQNAIISKLLNGLLDSYFPVWNLDKYTIYDQDFQDKLYQYEDLITANITNYISSKDVETSKLIDYIHTKYASLPLFAVNVHAIVYAKYALNYLQNESAFTIEDVQLWLNGILQGSNININNLINWCKGQVLDYNEYDFNFICFLVLQDFIINLTNDDDFKDLIMTKLIPEINLVMSREYKIDINWYQMVDKIIYLFKLILYDDLIAALNGDSTKLFYELKSEMVPHIKSLFSSHICNPTRQEVQGIFEFERADTDRWFYIFNSFFKTSLVTSYTEYFLKNAYSI